MQFIAFDSHKHYTLVSVEGMKGGSPRETRVEHKAGALRGFLETCEAGSPVAVECVGNWYWIVDEIEAAGFVPRLVDPRKAKLMMGMVNKTDKLDARGLNRLQRAGTLPTVWIPPAVVRDQRDIPRTRMVLVRQRTQLKNRIHAALAKYAIQVEEVEDLFGKKGREILSAALGRLPPATALTTERSLAQVDCLGNEIDCLEKRMGELFAETEEIRLLRTLPGVAAILSVVIALEVGDVNRFARAESLASYAGLVPRVHSSGGRTRLGHVRGDVNRYLKWAFVEAANSICRNRRRLAERHASKLYERVRRRKDHARAIVAVGRHLAEATYWMLKRNEEYRDPALGGTSSTEA